MKQKFNYLFLLLAVAIPFAFTNCGKDDSGVEEEDTVPLALSKTNVNLDTKGENSTASATIDKGNGDYVVTTDEVGKAFVTANLAADNKTINFTATGVAGEATVTVRDAKGKTATIGVKVASVPELLAKFDKDSKAIWTVETTEISNPKALPENILLDGTMTFWEPQGPFPLGISEIDSKSIIIDMASEKTITKIILGRRTDYESLYVTDTRKVNVYLSKDKAVFPTEPTTVVDFEVTLVPEKEENITPALSARYIKLSIVGANARADKRVFVSIASINAWGY